jgi:outer membrane autotransporter protein
LALLAGLMLLAGPALGSRPAAAQTNVNPSLIQAIVNPRLVIERMREIRTAVKTEVGRKLAPGPNVDAAALAYLEGEETAKSPTADIEAAAAPIRWSVWLDGSYTDIEDSQPLRAFDSDQSAFVAGLDGMGSGGILFGALFSYGTSDTRDFFVPGTSSADSSSVGPYIGAKLTDNIVFDASFLYTWSDNSSRDATGVTADYDGENWNLNANLTGYWYAGNWRHSPSLGISYSETRDDGYVNSIAVVYPAETSRTGVLTFGTTAAYTIRLDDTRSVEPYVTVEGEWEFENSVSPAIFTGPRQDTRNFDARVEAGLEMALMANVALSLRGEVGGLARKRYRTLSGGGHLSVSF